MRLVVALALLLTSCAPRTAWVSDLREGDIVFQISRSAQSLAVQRATGSRYSHMGMVLMRGGQPCVFEAVSIVRCTAVAVWVTHGVGSHFVVKRLRNARQILTPTALEKMRATAGGFEGRQYDLLFGWSDEKLYCSELVWKVYERGLGVTLSAPRRVSDFNLSDPVVQKKLRERYGTNVPLDEPAVAPADIYASPQLVTVVER